MPELSGFADATPGQARTIAQKGLGGAAMKPFVANAKGNYSRQRSGSFYAHWPEAYAQIG